MTAPLLTLEIRRDRGGFEVGCAELPCVGRGWNIPEALQDFVRVLQEMGVEKVLEGMET